MKLCNIGLLVLIVAGAAVGVARSQEKAYKATYNVEYGRRDSLALTMDVYVPAKPNGAAILGIVSAGFRSSPTAAAPFKDEFLKRGYTVFSVIPSNAPRFTVQDMHEDVCRAVRFVRYHHKTYKIDPNRIGIGGMSSGGLLALLVATSPKPRNIWSLDGVERTECHVQATCNFFPPTDFFNYGAPGKEVIKRTDQPLLFRAAFDFRTFDTKEGVYERVTDKKKVREIYREISPIYHVSAKTPPTLLIGGTADKVVPFQQLESFGEELKKHKVPEKLIPRKDAGHGWLTMLDDLRIMADWYDKHLLKKAK
jgi:acetyl esterase/lipase